MIFALHPTRWHLLFLCMVLGLVAWSAPATQQPTAWPPQTPARPMPGSPSPTRSKCTGRDGSPIFKYCLSDIWPISFRYSGEFSCCQIFGRIQGDFMREIGMTRFLSRMCIWSKFDPKSAQCPPYSTPKFTTDLPIFGEILPKSRTQITRKSVLPHSRISEEFTPISSRMYSQNPSNWFPAGL